MTLQRSFKWMMGVLLAPIILLAICIAIFGWNWLRGPIEHIATQKTGRLLTINGDLKVEFGWPLTRVLADGVSFANPAWAKEKQMVTTDALEIAVDFPQLLRRNVVLREVRLEQPVIFLEQGSEGRKNWLLDINQQDEKTGIRIDRLALNHGTLGYDNAQEKTSIRSELSTEATASGAGLTFTAQGRYKNLSLTALGTSGPVLGLRDDDTPYPLNVELAVGRTRVKAKGTITSLLKFTAMDMHLAVRGESLAQLYPLLGITFPETRSYATEGHIVHDKKTWRYEKFSGRIGESDVAGTLQVDTGGNRTAMTASLVSNLLDLDDLGPLIGAQPGKVEIDQKAAPLPTAATPSTRPNARVLPDIPFKTDRWNSVDAEVTIKAKTIRRAKELPLEDLDTHLSLHDSVLTLDPLNFGVAGGDLSAMISLDGRKNPIEAHAKIKAKKILIAKLFPTIELNKNSIGQINGEIDLTGKGNSIGSMLASSNGKAGLVIANGEISRLMMEKIGLHLWEILELKLTGDKLVKLRCGVADFDVKQGNMHADALIFDTEVTTIIASGNINLSQETLDLTLNQKTKNTSPLALRSPIYVRGTFANPSAEVDKTRVAARGLGAIGLGLLNPFLALMPLIDAGPGKDSDCGQLVRDTKAQQSAGNQKPASQ